MIPYPDLNREDFQWRDAQGHKIPLWEIDDNYLNNIINLLGRTDNLSDYAGEVLRFLEDEREIRRKGGNLSMCLDIVDSKPKKTSGLGYKLLRYESTTREMYTGYMSGLPQLVKIGVPVIDTSRVRLDTTKGSYLAGFHIFPAKKDVRMFQDAYGWESFEIAIVRVKYSNVVATGTQGKMSKAHVVVAKEFTATKLVQIGGRLI